MGFGKRPEAPDPMQTAQQQQQFNRDSMRDATGFNQIGQETPWGSQRWEGDIGDPNRKLVTEMNPQDQARLEQERQIKSSLLAMIMGGGQGGGGGKQGGGQPMPGMQTPGFNPNEPPPPMAQPQQPPMQPQPQPTPGFNPNMPPMQPQQGMMQDPNDPQWRMMQDQRMMRGGM